MGAFKTDPYCDSEKGDGEHFHALVWVPDYDSFVAALHAWGDKQGIHRKARDWEIPSGWARHRDHGRSHDLRMNVCRTFNYMTLAFVRQQAVGSFTLRAAIENFGDGARWSRGNGSSDLDDATNAALIVHRNMSKRFLRPTGPATLRQHDGPTAMIPCNFPTLSEK